MVTFLHKDSCDRIWALGPLAWEQPAAPSPAHLTKYVFLTMWLASKKRSPQGVVRTH